MLEYLLKHGIIILLNVEEGEIMSKKFVINNTKEIQYIRPSDPAAKGSMLGTAIGSKEGWEDYVMRIVRIEPGGTSFNHNHNWPHINYYISGSGILTLEGKEYGVKEGDYTYVPENQLHQWKNNTDEIFEFICIVPKEGHNI